MGSASITGISYIDRNDRRNAPKRKPVPTSSRQPPLTRQAKRDSKTKSKDLTFLEPRTPPLSPKPSIVYSGITALPQPGHGTRHQYNNDTADRQTLRSLRSQRSARESLRNNFKHFSLGSAYSNNDKADRKSKRKSVEKSSISRPVKADTWSRPAGAPSLAGSHYRQPYDPPPELQHANPKPTAYRSVIYPTRPLSTLDFPSQRYGTFYHTPTHPNSETSSFTVRIKPQGTHPHGQGYAQPPTARTFLNTSNRNSDNTDETLFSTGTADTTGKSNTADIKHHHYHHLHPHIHSHNHTNGNGIPEEPELKSEWFSSTSSLSGDNRTESKRAQYRRLLERVSRKNLREGLGWGSAVTSVVGSVTGRGERGERSELSKNGQHGVGAGGAGGAGGASGETKAKRRTRGGDKGQQVLAGVREDPAPTPASGYAHSTSRTGATSRTLAPTISRPFQGRPLGGAAPKVNTSKPIQDGRSKDSRSKAATTGASQRTTTTTGFKDQQHQQQRSHSRPPTGPELRDLREKARRMNRSSLTLRLPGTGKMGEKRAWSEKGGRGGVGDRQTGGKEGKGFWAGLCCL